MGKQTSKNFQAFDFLIKSVYKEIVYESIRLYSLHQWNKRSIVFHLIKNLNHFSFHFKLKRNLISFFEIQFFEKWILSAIFIFQKLNLRIILSVHGFISYKAMKWHNYKLFVQKMLVFSTLKFPLSFEACKVI